ncbi:MAG: hypothetical protein ACI4VH_03125 [Clostridia bacterium]
MNVTLPEKENLKRKYIIIYGIIIAFCIISLLIAFYVQFYARIDIAKLIGINQEERFGQKDEEEIELLKTDFLKIFTNSIENSEGQNNGKKVDTDKDLVYTQYEKKESKVNSYDLEIHIPHINVESEIVDEYNKEIEDVFANMARKVLQSENRNIIYTVEYTANVQDGILSVMIHSNFKEGSNAQKVIIKTYNYDLRNNKEVTLSDLLRFEQLDEQKIQNQINAEIETEQKKVEDLKQLGYNIYNRDTTSDIYKIGNTTEFYITNDVLYIIYAYGNESNTSEMDLIII